MIKDRLNNINWQEQFSVPIYNRALSYYEEKRVLDLETENLEENGLKILSKVQGSAEIYQVEMVITEKENLHLYASCSCPMRHRCKHILATILMYSSDPLSPPQYLQNWMKNVVYHPQYQVIKDELDPTYGLYFNLQLISPAKMPRIKMNPILIRHLKSGELGSKKKFSTNSISNQRHLTQNDKHLIAQLEVGHKLRPFASFDEKLTTEFDEKNLLDILKTQKCFWNENVKQPLSIGLDLPLAFQWNRLSRGDLELKLLFPYQHGHYFLIENLWYCDLENHCIGRIAHDLPLNLMHSLLQIPTIKNDHIPWMQEFIHKENLQRYIAVPEQLNQTVLDDVIPVPSLRIFAQTCKNPPYYYPEKIELLLAELTFAYQNFHIPWNDAHPRIERIENGSLISIKRNLELEKNAVNLLATYDIFLLKSINYAPKIAQKYENFYSIDTGPGSQFTFSQQIVPQLLKKGWIVRYDEDYPYQLVQHRNEWYSEIKEDQTNDWFDVELGIELAGRKVNLLPMIQEFLQKHSLSDLNEQKNIYLPIDEVEYVSIETERLKPIVETLLNLKRINLTEDEHLRLSKYHAAYLLEIEKAFQSTQLRWMGGDKLRDLGKKIADFSGITPVLPPTDFQAQLRPYQQEGLNWLQFLREYELSGILADDMGLGKTIQTLAHISVEKAAGRMNFPVLVIAPTSLMFNWQAEAKKFTPHLKVLILQGLQRKGYYEEIPNYDLILTTYPLLVRDKDLLLKQQFHLLILDEAQFIKNANALTTQVALQIQANHRLCLTGTPMENHLGELWSQFHFLMPGLLGEKKRFNKNFRHPIEKNKDRDCHQKLQKLMKPFMLRRTKALVAPELPEKTEMIRYVELSTKQQDLYEAVRVSMHEKIQKEVQRLGFARSQIIILDALLKLRQICCDPRLIKNKSIQKKIESAKLKELIVLSKQLIEEDRKILIFSQFTEMLALIESALQLEEIPYLKLTGQTQNRQALVESFQGGNFPVFLISLKAGGVGLNLTMADTVIHYDPWWNPAAENQATDRAYRIGQDKKVLVYKLVAKNTIEEKILTMQERKNQLISGLLEQHEQSSFKISEQDIQDLFAQM